MLRSTAQSPGILSPVRGRCRSGWLVSLSLLLLGCQGGEPENPAVPDIASKQSIETEESIETGETTEPSETSEPGNAIQPRTETWPEIQTAIPQRGIAIIDFWSLSCPPCLEALPDLVDLKRRHGDALTAITVSVDFDGRKKRPPEFYTARVREFLQSIDAESLQHFQSATPDADVYLALNAASIPIVRVYQDGELVRQFEESESGLSYAKDIAPLVAKLIGAN